MQYVTSFERIGMEKGRQQGRQQGLVQKSREDVFEVLRARFAHIPLPLEAKLQGIESLSRLSDLLRQAVTAASLQEFQKLVNAYKD